MALAVNTEQQRNEDVTEPCITKTVSDKMIIELNGF